MQPVTARATTPVSSRRRWLFRGIAFLLPLGLLALVEGLLRLVGYGHDLRLFVTDAEQPAYWVMNPYASRRYFTQVENAPVGNFERFRKQKAPGTLRLFVLGESTTIGYPYMHNGSFHRWLHYRLLHTLPARNVEVINLAMTAVNSYTALGFAEELADYAPDAVLVYVGHNEYYGALGVGSTSQLGSYPSLVRWLLRWRSLRLVQGLSQVLGTARTWAGGRPVDTRTTLMQRMAAKQQIPYGSATYQRGIAQFDDNISRLCAVFSRRRVPVFISTLVSTEKDLPPFISAPGPGGAATWYQHATSSYASGQFAAAGYQYQAAREQDLLRFRAPQALNTIIRALPTRYPNVVVVDAERRFRQHSPHGILGRELLLEHVHPTLHGYALLSDVFYEALRQHHLWAAPQHEMSFAILEQRMPVTAVDSLKGTYEIAQLRQQWPFHDQPGIPANASPDSSVEVRLAQALLTQKLSWNEAMERLMATRVQARDTVGALQVAEAVALEYPTDPTFCHYAATFSWALGRYEQAALYLRKAFVLRPSAALAQQLGSAYVQLDQLPQALECVAYVRAQAGPTPALAGWQALLTRTLAQQAALQRTPNDPRTLNELALAYQRLGNEQVAASYARRAAQAAARPPFLSTQHP